MKIFYKMLLCAFFAVLLASCSEKKGNDLSLANVLQFLENEGIFYVLEDKNTQKQNAEKIYLSIQKNKELYALSATFAGNNEAYFEGNMTENNLSFILQEVNNPNNMIEATLLFDNRNRPTMIAYFRGVLDGLAASYELSPIKLNSLEFAKNITQFEQEKSGTKYQGLLSDEAYLIPANSLLESKVKDAINADIAYGATTLSQLKSKLEAKQKQDIEAQTQPSFYSEYIDTLFPFYVDENILVFTQLSYSYTGGAHGISHLKTRIYSLKNGASISSKTSDLFENPNDPKLLNFLLEGLKEYDKKSNFAEAGGVKRFLEWDGTAKEFVPFPEEFFISSRGVEFVFEPYEIASYAEGYIRIRLKFKDLKNFVKKDSPLASYFK